MMRVCVRYPLRHLHAFSVLLYFGNVSPDAVHHVSRLGDGGLQIQ